MKHSLAITLILVAVFFVTQVVGLAITNQVITKEVDETGNIVNVTAKSLPLSMERPEVEESQSYLYIIGAVLIGTILVLLLIKFKGVLVWKFWFLVSVALCLIISFATFLPQILAVLLGIVMAILKIYKSNFVVHNLTEIFIYGGLAAIFVPIMNIYATVLLLILISVYDMIAVWQSKHMVKMAKFQTTTKVFAGLSIPYHISLKRKKVKKTSKKESTEGKSAILGGGDMGFPLLFAGVLLKSNPFLKVLIVPVLVTLALFLLLYFAKKDRFYPAMPFITLGCFAGYGLMLLI